MSEIDETDRKILSVLRRNGREPIKGIAAKTGLARSTVRHRMERMEKSGIITGYRVELSKKSDAGLEAFLLVQLKETPSYPVVEAAVIHPEVQRCYSLSGETDLIIEINAGHAERLNEIRDEIARHEAVANVKTSIVLSKNFETGKT